MQTLYDVEKKDRQLLANQKEIEKERAQRNFIISALLFFVLLFIIAIWAFQQKRKTSRLLEMKNTELEHANQEISHQKEQLSEKQKEIVDSITYAKKIQNALLASEEMLFENFIDHFVLFKPKDIVSGDFTWATKNNNLLYLACCDSTGHGVPGAFMSLLNIGFLSEAVKERHILEPGNIFNYVRDRLIETIGKDEQQDGFDGILLCIDMNTKEITYAAANNAPMIIRDNEVITLACNKMPVGKGIKTDSFETYTLTTIKNDHLYLFTDGYPDQFGGPKGKKFKYKQLEELLKQNTHLDLDVQKKQLNERFETWKGPLEQVDDVCIIGISL
jgi:serine phosphatase RsbU (regulator of sigma subunit)